MDYGAKLAQMEQRLKEVERASRMSSASLDDTALEVRDSDGSLRAIVGQQADGTSGVNVVNGPTPPTPTDPTVEAGLAALTVTWDGTFTDAQAAPLDWMRMEVHVGPTTGFTPDQGTLRDTIETALGGSVVISLPYTEWFVKLRSRSTSGVAGAASNSVAGTPHKAQAADINAGAVTAEAIAVDALTGKTITGGLITGSVIQTAATGERITMNENSANKVIVYDSAGNIVGELSDAGLILTEGTTTDKVHLTTDPHPRIDFHTSNGAVVADAQIGFTNPGGTIWGINGPDVGVGSDSLFFEADGAGFQKMTVDFQNRMEINRSDFTTRIVLDDDGILLLGAVQVGSAVHQSGATWQTPAFSATWASGNTLGGNSPFQGLRFRKTAEDEVWVYGTAVSSGTASTIFTLPAGYRPPAGARALLPCYFSSGSGTPQAGWAQVTDAGAVAGNVTISGWTVASGTQVFINGKFPLGNLA